MDVRRRLPVEWEKERDGEDGRVSVWTGASGLLPWQPLKSSKEQTSAQIDRHMYSTLKYL